MADYRRVSAVLFDMGGVLLRLYPTRVFEIWSNASGISVETIGSRWAIDEAYKAYETGEMSFEAYIQCLSESLGIRMTIDQWRRGWNALVGKPYEDVFENVNELASEVPVYCFTNSNPEHEGVFMSEYSNDLSVFRHIFNSSTLGRRKPDVTAFELVARLIGFNPEEILFIDDNAANIEGASLAGLIAHQTNRSGDTIELIAKVLHAKKN